MKNLKKIVSVFMMLVFMTMLVCQVPGDEKLDDLKQQQKANEQKKEELEKKKSTTQDDLRKIDSQISDVSNQLYQTSTKLDNTRDKIEKTQKKLKEAQASVKTQYSEMKLRIKYMYENGNTQILDLILNSKDITEFLNKAEYITELSQYDRKMLNRYKKTRQTIADAKKTLETEEKNLVALQSSQKTQRASLESLSDSKKNQLANYDDAIKVVEASHEDIEKEIANQEAAIQRALQQEKERQRKAAQAAAAAAAAAQANKGGGSNAGGSGGTSTPAPSGSGSWGWPLPGHTRISSDFGPRSGGYHNGIDIPAPAGTTIVAASSGTVAWANYSTSAGNWVGITHANGATSVYMHMSSSCVSAGQSVSQGQTIGFVGNTGASQGNHLHFSVKLGGITGSWANPWNYLG